MSNKAQELLTDMVLKSLPTDLPENIIELWKSNPGWLRSHIRKLLYDYPQFVSFPTTVDYDKSVEQLIIEGRYARFNNRVTSENFPTAETGQKLINIFLSGRGRQLTNYEISEMYNSYPKSRPATLKELLTLCIAYPTVQNFNSIVALGNQWNGYHPFIDGYGDAKEKRLELTSRHKDDDWSYGTCFALVELEK